MLAAGATCSPGLHENKASQDLFKGDHAEFSFIDVLQSATYFNLTDYYNAHAYEMREGRLIL